MTADVNRDRRVTVPILGFDTLFVDWSRLFWALLSLVHERLGYRVLAPDRIQGDAVLSVFNFTAQSRITSRHSIARPLRPLRPDDPALRRARRRQGVACQERSLPLEHNDGQP